MQLTRRLLLSILFYLSGFIHLLSIPAFPTPVRHVQPDGTSLLVRIYGDEFKKVRTTIDGIPVRYSASGFYVYDVPLRSAATEVIARDPGKRSDSESVLVSSYQVAEPTTLLKAKSIKRAPVSIQSTAFPTTGTPRSLVIMVNFTDKEFSNSAQAFTRLLNEQGYSDNGATGSARDYFRASSQGAFNPQFDVVGPYNLSNPITYYGANDEDDYDIRPAHMVVEACSLANKDVNFADYDADNDGYVDNIFIYYAGYNEAEGGPVNTVWPHRWWVYSGNYPGSVSFDGKRVSDYACTSELRGNSGSQMCGIGTFTHEFGHVIGLPDHYHTEDPDKNTLDYWSIMDLGAYLNEGRTPPAYSSYDRFYLGWVTPEELKSPSQQALYPLSQSTNSTGSTSGQTFLLSASAHNLSGINPSPGEFFMFEYRKKTGWDKYLPGEGMLIWHIDYDPIAWNNNGPNNYTGTSQTLSSHMRIYLQPLTGNSTTPGAAFTSGSFQPTTWKGVKLDQSITNITKTSDSIQFRVSLGTATSKPVIKVGEVKNELKFGEIKLGGFSVKLLNLKTTAATGVLQISIAGLHPEQFAISATSLTAADTENAEGKTVEITYKPGSVGQHQATLTIKSEKLPERTVELKGEARE